MYFFLDTNVWIKEKTLKSSLGVLFVYFLKRHGGVIVDTEINNIERQRACVKDAHSIVGKLNDLLSHLQVSLGKKPSIEIPLVDEFSEALEARMKELEGVLKHYKLDLNVCLRSIHRTVNQICPCHKGEQMRDAMIWESILQFATEVKDSKIYFVTDDSDFKMNKEFHPDLVEEASNSGVHLIDSLSKLLSEFEIEPPGGIDIWGEILSRIPNYSDRFIDRYEFCLNDIVEKNVQFFATEQPNILFFEFLIKYEITDFWDFQMSCSIDKGVLIVVGDGEYDINESVINVNIKTEEIKDDGGYRHHLNLITKVYARPDYIPYSVRSKIGS